MDELIIRQLQGKASPEEERELAAWLDASPHNGDTHRRICEMWTWLPATPVDPSPPAADQLIAIAEARQKDNAGVPLHTWGRGRWVALAVAASVAFLLFANTADLRQQSTSSSSAMLPYTEWITGPGETEMLHLDDGTIAYLAPESRLQVWDDDLEASRIWLDGRAFFGVSRRDGELPFVVQTPAGEVIVLGTRFEVFTEDEETRVLVVDGRIELSTTGGIAQVGAGEISIAGREGVPLVDQVEDVDDALEWMGRSLVFQETPVWQVAREVERRYGVVVHVADEEIGQETITGGFHDEELSDVLDTICRVVSARCSINSQAVITAWEP